MLLRYHSYYHLLIIGLVKTQWYGIWIQQDALRPNTETGTKRELDILHEILREV